MNLTNYTPSEGLISAIDKECAKVGLSFVEDDFEECVLELIGRLKDGNEKPIAIARAKCEELNLPFSSEYPQNALITLITHLFNQNEDLRYQNKKMSVYLTDSKQEAQRTLDFILGMSKSITDRLSEVDENNKKEVEMATQFSIRICDLIKREIRQSIDILFYEL